LNLDLIAYAFQEVIFTDGFIFLLLGVLLGLVFGVIPGLGGTTALALLIPITYYMDSIDAMLIAGGVMGAVSFGGSVTAILINTPGTAPSAATCFDGYPLAQQGKAGLALGASAAASSLGGIIGLFTLLLVIPIAKSIVLFFGPPEFFLLALLGLTAIAVSARGKLLRGLISGGIGLMLAFVGYDAVSGGLRYTAGSEYLWDGIPLVPTLTGLFAIAQMMELAMKGGSVAAPEARMRIDRVFDGVIAVFRHWPALLRGSAIGTLIGAVPGLGGTVAAFMAYTSAVQVSKEPETFGKGNIIGVIAPEAANNAKDGGALLPTVAFGIPGSAETAVFLAILVLHGIDPGPTILIHHQREVYGLIASLTASAVLASIIGLAMTRWLRLITVINVHFLIPVVVAISLTGVYVLRGEPVDMILTLVMGLLGYLMIRFDYPRLTLVIALVLGEIAERAFHQTNMISNDDYSIYLTRPASLVLIGAIILTAVLPSVQQMRRSRQKAKLAVE
jgi:putative tricarboxylic transport membrane protein